MVFTNRSKSSVDVNKMDVKDQVKHKVACIQDTILNIADVQQQLKLNCLEAKSAIHSSISRQLETLRSREVWLLNQVDTVCHIKEERLQGQLACLLHELGGLQHVLQMAQNCGHTYEDLKKELFDTLYRLKDVGDEPLEEAKINFTADLKKLRRAICSYGSINSAGHTMEDNPIPDSLCNSMDGLSLINEAAAGRTTVNETFPPFTATTNPSEWLAQRDADDSNVLNSDTFVIPPFDDQPSSSQQLESYFREVNASPASEWLLDSGRVHAEFRIGKSYPYAVMNYFREISNDVKDWLLDYEKSHQEDTEEEEKVPDKDCKADICKCAAPPERLMTQAIEIENLDQLLCIQDPVAHVPVKKAFDKNMWLRNYPSKKVGNKWQPPNDLPSVEIACKANECCRSFTECVCDTNCAVTAITESNSSVDQGQILSYFQSVSNNPADWLVPTTATEILCPSIESMHVNKDQDHRWLQKNQENAFVPSSDVCQFAYFQSVSANPSDWLHHTSGAPNSSDAVANPLDTCPQQNSDKVNNWLVDIPPEKAVAMEESSVSESKDDENAKWLCRSNSSQENSLDVSGYEVVQKYHAQLAQSDWLALQVQPNSKCEGLMDSSSLLSPSVASVEAYKLFLQLGSNSNNSD